MSILGDRFSCPTSIRDMPTPPSKRPASMTPRTNVRLVCFVCEAVSDPSVKVDVTGSTNDNSSTREGSTAANFPPPGVSLRACPCPEARGTIAAEKQQEEKSFLVFNMARSLSNPTLATYLARLPAPRHELLRYAKHLARVVLDAVTSAEGVARGRFPLSFRRLW